MSTSKIRSTTCTLLVGLAVLLGLCAAPAWAELVIANASFETPVTTALAGNTPFTGSDWLVDASPGTTYGYAGAGVYHEDAGYAPDAPDGTQWAIMNVDSDSSAPTYMYQDMGTDSLATTATFDYIIATPSKIARKSDVTISVWEGATWAGRTLLDSATATAPGTVNTASSRFSTDLDVTNSGSNIWLSFSLPTYAPGDILNQMLVDDVGIMMVPEPSTLAMLLLGAVSLFIWRRRR